MTDPSNPHLHFGPWKGRVGTERLRQTTNRKHKVSVWKNSKGIWRGESRKLGISFALSGSEGTSSLAEARMDQMLRACGCTLDDA